MQQAHPPEPINWKQVISTEEPPELEGSVQQQGVVFHRWLKERFETRAVPFERELDWLTSPDEQGGRFDCFDGYYVYEFKTVDQIPASPRSDDVDQLRQYLSVLDTAHGVIVYIVRGSFEVCQFLVERG